MTGEPATTPTEAESRPNVARMYDYYLGGCHNFAVDRAAAERLAGRRPHRARRPCGDLGPEARPGRPSGCRRAGRQGRRGSADHADGNAVARF
nr:SAM-dependent methyltransferase [Micromonospora sp. RTP1Z1]